MDSVARSSFRRTKFTRYTAWIILFLLIEFFDELHFGIQSAVLPSIRQDLGLNYAQIGILLGLPGVISAIVEPIIMLLGDTRLRKPLVIGGGLTIATTLLLIAGTASFPVLLIAFILSYPASGAFVSLSQATLMDLNPGREHQMMARWTVAGSIGNLVGPLLLAASFAIGLSWRWSYVSLALFALSLVLVILPRRFPGRQTHVGLQSEQMRSEIRKILSNLWFALKQPNLLRWFGLLELSDLLLDVFTSYAALYFADVVGFSPTQTGIMMSILMAASLGSDLILIPLLERVPGRRLVRISATIAIFVYAAWLLVPWPLAKVILTVAIRFSTTGWYPVLQGETYAALPGRSGTVAAINSAAGLAGKSLVWLIGWVAALAGLPVAMWLLLAGPLSLALFVPKDSLKSSDNGQFSL